MNTWLTELQPNDLVLVSKRYNKSVEVIDRITKTMIILKNGQRFSIKSGNKVGDHELYFSFLEKKLERIKYE